MNDTSWLARTGLLIGAAGLQKLIGSHVLIVGLGGVGSFAAEFIARAGVGKMTIVDGDVVEPTNRNRQLPALSTNHGESKAHIMAERLKAINPELDLTTYPEFISPQMVKEIMTLMPDFTIDAIDSITPKLNFIQMAYENRLPFVSCMGAGGKIDPTLIRVADISRTYNCKLAHYVRKRLHQDFKIYKGIKAVFSPEMPLKSSLMMTDGSGYKRSAYGTVSYMPAAFGGVAASVAIRALIAK